jgi:hypothetical protein
MTLDFFNNRQNRNKQVKSRSNVLPGGDLASTWVVKLEVHAELQITRKTDCKLLVANDDNYALAA